MRGVAKYIVHKGARILEVRWDEEDIGAIEVNFDGTWQPVPAVHPGLEGQHARIWITARHALRTKTPERKRWEEDVVRKAIEDIVALNAHRSLQFGLINKAISADQLERLEETLFDGFGSARRSRRRSRATGRVDPLFRALLSPPPRAHLTTSTCLSTLEDAEIENLSEPAPRQADDDWTLEP